MHDRNAGLQRLRSLTKRIGVATAVLTGILTGFAAAANSGHHRRLTVVLPPRRRVTPTPRPARIPPAPSLPPLTGEQSTQSPTQPPSPPAAPPVQTQAPPVAVSGGS
jgi:hypothetical protein